MDIDITIKGGEELLKLHPKKYERIEEKIGNMFMDGFPEVTSTCIDREAWETSPRSEQDRLKEITTVRIFMEGGGSLIEIDTDAYFEMVGKIKALVKETFPQVLYCDVESWGLGYYRGDQVRKALADILSEGKFINELASAIRDLPVETAGKVAEPILKKELAHA
ncbi:MAG TPA: hypothetical protein PKM50_08110 [Methanoregula sp.]|nr:hypothetical protein [Methanoregula sp.]